MKTFTIESNPEYFCPLCKKSYFENYKTQIETIYKRQFNGKTYYRIMCDECFKFKYNKTIKKSASRWTENLAIVFNISLDEFQQYKKENKTTHLQKFIKKYGNDLGKQKYEEYRKRQALTNTYEYKHQKYNMSKEEFDEYNKNRACTLENLIKRHGEDIGNIKWKQYCDRQAYAGNKLEYFQEKFGKELGEQKYKEVCESKAFIKQRLIKRFGKKIGTEKYINWYTKIVNNNKQQLNQSKIANDLFNYLDNHFSNNNFKFFIKNEEYMIYLKTIDKYAFLDFYDLETNKAIEFYGDYWHGHPTRLKNGTYTLNCFNTYLTIEEKQNNDKIRIECLKKEYNIDTLIIWEYDWIHSKELCIKKCVDFLER